MGFNQQAPVSACSSNSNFPYLEGQSYCCSEFKSQRNHELFILYDSRIFKNQGFRSTARGKPPFFVRAWCFVIPDSKKMLQTSRIGGELPTNPRLNMGCHQLNPWFCSWNEGSSTHPLGPKKGPTYASWSRACPRWGSPSGRSVRPTHLAHWARWLWLRSFGSHKYHGTWNL